MLCLGLMRGDSSIFDYNEKEMQKVLFYGFVIFPILFFIGCSGNQVDKDGGDLLRSEVEVLSEKMSEAVEKEFPLLKHKFVNRYVDALGQSIVARNPDMPPLPYEFRLLKNNETFVFSLPGGVVYLTLGTLRSVELEGQLAAAIAHELAHQQLNHYLVMWRKKVNGNRNSNRNLLDFSGEWRARFLGENGAIVLGNAAEEEADRLAPVILYKAGFDPRLYVSYLEILQSLKMNSPEQVREMLSIQPPTEARIKWAKEIISSLPPLKDPIVSSSTFKEVKAMLLDAEKKVDKKDEKKNKKQTSKKVTQ